MLNFQTAEGGAFTSVNPGIHVRGCSLLYASNHSKSHSKNWNKKTIQLKLKKELYHIVILKVWSNPRGDEFFKPEFF